MLILCEGVERLLDWRHHQRRRRHHEGRGGAYCLLVLLWHPYSAKHWRSSGVAITCQWISEQAWIWPRYSAVLKEVWHSVSCLALDDEVLKYLRTTV